MKTRNTAGKKKKFLFVVPYNPVLGSRGPQGPKNVSQPLIDLISNLHDMVLIVVSEDQALTKNKLHTIFPEVQDVHVVRPLSGWARRFARLRFILQGLPPSLADGLSRELSSLMGQYAASTDIVHFEYFTLSTHIRVVQPFACVQLHCHDAYSLYQKRIFEQADNITDKFLALIRYQMFRNLERRLIANATTALTVSPIDQQYLAYHGLSNVYYLPPALQEIKISIPPLRKNLQIELLCIVSASYQHSQATALLDFFREKFPLLAQLAGGTLPVTLFGKSSKRIRAELLPFVEVEAVEFVDDYFIFLSSRNWICFYPQRAGAGLHTKLRDIMAAQLPVVGYKEIMDAFLGTSGEHYFSCDNIEQVATAISSLLSDPDLHERVAKGGLRLLSEKFGPASVLDTWEKLTQDTKNINLPHLQELQLSIAMKVRHICEKHDIPYFLIAGTLLGAVRHKGFIPWDDDLDIGMLRENYDRFISLAQSELGNAYFLQTYTTDQHMPFPYAKLRINGTVMREASSLDCKWNNGIYIDIFPFDGVPENMLLRSMHASILKIIGHSLLIKCEFIPLNVKKSPIKYGFYKAIKYPIKFLLPRKILIKGFDFFSRFYSNKKTRLVVAAGGSYGYKRETISRSWVEILAPLIFCNNSFNCPSAFEDYLVNLYGDYMKLPPVENRSSRHNIVELKFLR
jgi:lipopolysaccharide cholinephosphotransferase